MKFLQTQTKVFKQEWTTFSEDCPRGSGYCADQGTRYLLIQQWFIGKYKIWSKVLDKEELDPHVWIHKLCFGDYGGWQSPFWDRVVELHYV